MVEIKYICFEAEEYMVMGVCAVNHSRVLHVIRFTHVTVIVQRSTEKKSVLCQQAAQLAVYLTVLVHMFIHMYVYSGTLIVRHYSGKQVYVRLWGIHGIILSD